MNSYVTASVIRRLREERHMTQSQLAEKLCVSSKAVSKWETGRSYPDITLIEPLSRQLGVSVAELLSGSGAKNHNRSFNMKRSVLYVCPVCGNILFASGEAEICCCGISLLPCEAEEADEEHSILIMPVEDEYYITVDHEMSRSHYISFIGAVRDNALELVKLYPEQEAEARIRISGTQILYVCCNRHGLFRLNIPTKKKTQS